MEENLRFPPSQFPRAHRPGFRPLDCDAEDHLVIVVSVTLDVLDAADEEDSYGTNHIDGAREGHHLLVFPPLRAKVWIVDPR